MADVAAAFDFYDERWRDCWIAASSVARLRKKQIDFDIRQRVLKLLEDYGPQTQKPLTLRIYGTMLKGFCVINNERARVLFCDCERVVLMFARQPFAEGDNKIHLPAAKRPRMEAALTLDLDLARVEANEAFDWTQAPLEEGALLRLGGGDLLQDALPPAFDLGAGAGAPALDPAAEAAMPAGEVLGWLPRLEDAPPVPPPAPDTATAAAGVPPAQELALPPEPLLPLPPQPAEAPQAEAPPQPPPPPPPPTLAEVPGAPMEVERQPLQPVQALALPPQKRAREPVIKPGVVYGFDGEPMLPAAEYERWQQDGAELARPRLRATDYAGRLAAAVGQAEHLGPGLRGLLDPSETVLRDAGPGLRASMEPVLRLAAPAAPGAAAPAAQAAEPPGHALPDVQQLLGAEPPLACEPLPDSVGAVPPEAAGALPPEAGAIVPMDVATAVPASVEPVSASLEAAFAGLGAAGGAAAPEAQDGGASDVLAIVRGCLQGGGLTSAAFEELVPPGAADRATAACTFAALLALASAGELLLQQGEPYGRIQISEVC